MDNIYQSIEILSKEKGIDAQIVLDAVKDAMLIAARKHFKTTENYDAVFDQKSGGLKHEIAHVDFPYRSVWFNHSSGVAAVNTLMYG